jgi:hypothetical protein
VNSEANLPDPLPTGYQLGHYTIQSELVLTRFGRMYKAWAPSFGRTVAIIVLAVELRGNQGCESFMRRVGKASLAGQPVYEMAEWLGVLYVAVGYSEDHGALVDL